MEDILLCIIIIIITPFGYVVPLIRDFIDVFVHVKSWGKTSVVIQINCTHKSIIKMYFWRFQTKSYMEARRIWPFWVIIPLISLA